MSVIFDSLICPARLATSSRIDQSESLVRVFTKRKNFVLSIVSRFGDDATEVKFNRGVLRLGFPGKHTLRYN